MSQFLRRLLPGLALGLSIVAGSALAQPTVETVARQAIMIDYDTGTVMFAKNADEPMPPSSMSKLMTAVMVFDRLAAGTLKLDDTFTVSERAWRMSLNEGSAMFLKLGDKVTIEDLLRGMIIQSGNDACVALAEGLAGSEQRFAEMMTQRGREIGLKNSTFKNASGWPEPDHMMTARDLATLATFIVRTYPQYYKYYSEKEFTYGVDIKTKKPIKQGNRNPLLYRDVGADGLKTGHTSAAGYGLTASAKRGDRRLVMVLNGMASIRERDRESERLIELGFREWENVRLATAGSTVETADVWLGNQKNVALLTEKDAVVTLPRKNRNGLKAVITYDNPIPAPVRKGMPVARIVVTAPEMSPVEIPLVAASDVERLGFTGRIGAAASHLIWGRSGK
jgi:D-alanyl-D-alanine carboxypeptidase (penicillin-binding protein 5/6)